MKKVIVRFALIVFGLLLGVIVLEIALRAASYMAHVPKKIAHVQTLQKNKNSYRILCLGESTTDGQWPPQLEYVLRKKYPQKNIEVIDKGVAGTNTYVIRDMMPMYLSVYKPDIVIAMMGINDVHPLDQNTNPVTMSRFSFIWQSSRIRLLWRLLVEHIRYSIKDSQKNMPAFIQKMILPEKNKKIEMPSEERIRLEGEALYMQRARKLFESESYRSALFILEKIASIFKQEVMQSKRSEYILLDYASALMMNDRADEAAIVLEEVIDAFPSQQEAYIRLVKAYIWQGEYERAQEILNRMEKRSLDHPEKLFLHAQVLTHFKQYDEAESLLQSVPIHNKVKARSLYERLQMMKYMEKRLAENQEDLTGINALIAHYEYLDDFVSIKELVDALIETQGENDKIFIVLSVAATAYMHKGRFSEALELLERMQKLFPDNNLIYVDLARLSLLQGDFERGVREIEQAIATHSDEKIAIDIKHTLLGIALNHYKEGNTVLAEKYREKMRILRTKNQHTVENYLKIKEMVQGAGIAFVAVQYPMRKVEFLVDMLNYDTTVHYVDNEVSFKKAVREYSYDKVFKDRFAGEFGHCTEFGNKLLAHNIAEVLIEEVL